ncbi:hypothetical protein CHCC20335_0334 [Bacillus paralicheniformis]|nr:hypothetical protein CHCC20335_0334 [Bacillus paralicheniformis]
MIYCHYRGKINFTKTKAGEEMRDYQIICATSPFWKSLIKFFN